MAIGYTCDECGLPIAERLRITANPLGLREEHFCSVACLVRWGDKTGYGSPASTIVDCVVGEEVSDAPLCAICLHVAFLQIEREQKPDTARVADTMLHGTAVCRLHMEDADRASDGWLLRIVTNILGLWPRRS